jgi:hypothetical protein
MAKKNGRCALYCAIAAALLLCALVFGCKEEKTGNPSGNGDNDIKLQEEIDGNGGVPPTEIQWEEKIYWEGNIDQDFDGSSVIVVMDKNIGSPNKVHDRSFFGDIEIEFIEDLSIVTNPNGLINWENWHQILMIKLPGDSKENVVRAIRHLEKIDGIRSAEPNHIDYPDML